MSKPTILAAKIVWIGMVLALVVAKAGADSPARHIFYAAAPGQFPDESAPPLLVREVARQAVLMAARDGLGLDTRDEVMRRSGIPTRVCHPTPRVLRCESRFMGVPSTSLSRTKMRRCLATHLCRLRLQGQTG